MVSGDSSELHIVTAILMAPHTLFTAYLTLTPANTKSHYPRLFSTAFIPYFTLRTNGESQRRRSVTLVVRTPGMLLS